jgi:hypothetical protein
VKRLMIVPLLFLLVVAAKASDDAPIPEPTQNPDATCRIFRTQNIYTLLRLDTRTGMVWQVQWGDGDHRFIAPISKTLLTTGSSTNPTTLKPGRFTLSPTKNIYTFVLLDQEDGRIWQVQWGSNDKERFIVAIPSY